MIVPKLIGGKKSSSLKLRIIRDGYNIDVEVCAIGLVDVAIDLAIESWYSIRVLDFMVSYS